MVAPPVVAPSIAVIIAVTASPRSPDACANSGEPATIASISDVHCAASPASTTLFDARSKNVATAAATGTDKVKSSPFDCFMPLKIFFVVFCLAFTFAFTNASSYSTTRTFLSKLIPNLLILQKKIM